MTKMSKRVLVSVLTLVLTVVALGTTTFAWFSISNVSSVSGIKGEVIAGEGLEVSINPVNTTTGLKFLNNLTEDHFNEFITNVGTFNKFGAVTTTNGIDFTQLAMVNNKMTLGQVAVSNNDYLEFELTFRSKAQGTVKLTNYEFGGAIGTFQPDGEPYIQIAGGGLSNDEVKTSAASGARIAFVKGTTVTGYQAPASIVIGSDTVTNMISGANPIEAGQWSYLTTGKGISIYKTATEKLETADLTNIDLLEAETVVSTSPLLSLSTSVPGSYYQDSIIVRLWIEGWDSDTYDSIFGLTLDVNLGFELKVDTP